MLLSIRPQAFFRVQGVIELKLFFVEYYFIIIILLKKNIIYSFKIEHLKGNNGKSVHLIGKQPSFLVILFIHIILNQKLKNCSNIDRIGF